MEIGFDVKKILKKSLAGGGDFSEIFVEERIGTTIISEQKRIERFNIIKEKGAGIRVVYGDRCAYAYTNDIDSISDLAATVAEAIKAEAFDRNIHLKTRKVSGVVLLRDDPAGIEPSMKIGIVTRAENSLWSYSNEVIQARITYGDMKRNIFIANSRGFIASDSMQSIILATQVIVAKETKMETGYEAVGGARGFELFAEISPEEIALRAGKRAVQSLNAREAPAGLMPVVLSSVSGGTMVHEAIGHGLEADLAGEGLSVYSGRIGQKVASKAITVIDDGTIKGLRGSIGCDDEGTPSKRTVLVKDGILKCYMTDLMNASKFNLKLTGNGRRESYRHRPVPRMTNTIIAPGKMEPVEIIAKVHRGLFVKKMGGGQVNTVTGDFVFEVSEGYMIENGQITEPVRAATLIGNGPDILNSIEYVGSDLGFAIGTCGKDGQGVPVADAQPTLLIPEITVGGKIENE